MAQQKKKENVTITGLKGLYYKSDIIWWKRLVALCNTVSYMQV
jgi:hypothetical protein